MAQVKGQIKEKEPATTVTSVYLHVVDDVIQNVRDDFQSEGVDESVLIELRQLWELKMMQAGAIQGASGQESSAPLSARGSLAQAPMHDLNVPYEATEEYQTPTVDLLFPPTPQVMTPLASTPLPATPMAATPLPMTPQPDLTSAQLEANSPSVTSTGEPIMYQYMPPGPSESSAATGDEGSLDLDTKLPRPASYMQPPAPWMNQKGRGVDVNIDVNATYDGGQEDEESGYRQAPVTKDFFTLAMGKRKREDLAVGPQFSGDYIAQQDGAADTPQTHSAEGLSKIGECLSVRSSGRDATSDADARLSSSQNAVSHSGSSHLPQYDGVNDDYDDGVAEEDYNEPGDEETQPVADAGPRWSKAEQGGDSDNGEPPLNEDDDDDLDDSDQGDEGEPQTDHLVLAQFDKVTRSKNKWKCTLKDGIMHLNHKDILFVKATGEFEF